MITTLKTDITVEDICKGFVYVCRKSRKAETGI